MSKPMTRSKPASCDIRAMPTMPPAGPDRIASLPRKCPASAQPAVGLHEHQPDAGQLVGDVLDVAAQDGREVGVDDGRVAARDELHQRADLAGQRDLREADACGQLADRLLVGGVEVAVHADDGDGIGCRRRTPPGAARRAASRSGARRTVPSAAMRSSTSIDPFVEQLGQHRSARSKIRGRFW